MSKKENNNVSVGVRIRPLNDKELQSNMPVCFAANGDGNAVKELDHENQEIVKNWPYDSVFGPSCSNKFIFDTMGAKLVDAAIDGYNTVLFMYGQTSSGKTFTLFGGGGTPGLVQYAMEHVYHRVKNSADTEYVIKYTYSELYNEELKDLLATTPNENLKIIDDPNLGPLIQNITEANFTTPADVKQVLDEGENRRHFGVTNMNAHSSRSHVMVRLSIETRKVPYKPANPLRSSWGKDKPMCLSTLNLVDLAGSERANKSGTSGQSLKEGSFINKSLLTLGTVIANLSEGKLQHIPYRNSKLTRLLASALGGNAKTCMITCISPASGNVIESLSTLRFASRAKFIVNHVQKNEIMDAKALQGKLAMQTAELDNLRNQLELSKQLGFNPNGTEEQADSLKDKLAGASRKWRNLRFLLRTGPKVVNLLRAQGMQQLAKKVQNDIKSAVAGSRDVNEIIDEQCATIEAHLPKEVKLLRRVQYLSQELDNDALISELDEDDIYGKEGLSHAMDDLHGSIAKDEDEFDLAGFGGGEEIREELEHARFSHEEFRAIAVKRVRTIEGELAEALNRERTLLKTSDDQMHTIADNQKALTKAQSKISELSQSLDDLKKQLEGEKTTLVNSSGEFRQKLTDAELKLESKEEQIRQLIHESHTKDSENEKLKKQIDQLNTDLSAAIHSRKAFEEETIRVRVELRTQMDRLRSNMHEIMVKGGEETKIVETRVSDLETEIDRLVYSNELLIESKGRLEMEISQLNSQIQLLRDDKKSQMEAMELLRGESAQMNSKLRQLRMQNMRLAGQHTVAEEALKKVRSEYADEVKARAAEVAAKEEDCETLRQTTSAQLKEMKYQLDAALVDITSLNEQLSGKAAYASKLEISLSSETARLEKKLGTQHKATEDLSKEYSALVNQIQSMQTKHLDEVKLLKQQIDELQGIVDSVNECLDQQQNDSSNDGRVHPSSTVDVYDNGFNNYYMPSSPNSGHYTGGSRGDRGSILSTFTFDDGSYTARTADETVEEADLVGNTANSVDQTNFTADSGTAEMGVYYSQSTKMAQRAAKIEKVRAASFKSIVYGMTLLLHSLQHSCNEEKVWRSFLTGHLRYATNTIESQNSFIGGLQSNEKDFFDVQQQLRESLEFMRNKDNQQVGIIENLESEYQSLKEEFLKISSEGQIANAKFKNAEQAMLDARAQLEKYRMESKHLSDTLRGHTEKTNSLEEKLKDVVEEHSVMQSKLDLTRQELAITAAEKEELIKRFMGDDYYSNHFTTAQATPITRPQSSSRRQTQDNSLSSDHKSYSTVSSPIKFSNLAKFSPDKDTISLTDTPYSSSYTHQQPYTSPVPTASPINFSRTGTSYNSQTAASSSSGAGRLPFNSPVPNTGYYSPDYRSGTSGSSANRGRLDQNHTAVVPRLSLDRANSFNAQSPPTSYNAYTSAPATASYGISPINGYK